MFCKENEGLNKTDNIVVWGTGHDGIACFITMLNQFIPVKYFCDSDEKKQQMHIMNKEVLSPNQLMQLSKKESLKVVIGSREHYEDIKKELERMGITSIYRNTGDYEIKVRIGNKCQLGSSSWYSVIQQAKNNKIFVYGCSETEIEFGKKLQLTGIEISGYICENDNIEDSFYKNVLLEDVVKLRREGLMIYVFTNVAERARRLEDLGLKHGENYQIDSFGRLYREKNPFVRIDTNLGYTYVDDERYPGYTVMGEENAKYRIMILGASATDPNYYWYTSWPEFLYLEMKKMGKSVRIFNGGQVAYSTQQELLKMLRDLPAIKPDMVIDFGGGIHVYNVWLRDSIYDCAFPFTSTYARNMLQNIKAQQRGHIDYEYELQIFGVKEKTELCRGVELKSENEIQRVVSSYCYAVNCMHAICKEYHINFWSFLDPLPIWSEKLGTGALEKIYHDNLYLIKAEAIRSFVMKFKSEVTDLMDKAFWRDLSGVLGEYDNVYEEAWHPNQKGNEIIAKNVYKIIIKEIEHELANRESKIKKGKTETVNE